MMIRTEKPAVKIETYTKKKRSDIEDDFINYGLGNFLDIARSSAK